ncbi:2-phospho-L-lactate guanylyltransferase [Haloprofundus halophilus]|uniref:2-phospho-L-lactate guanylyltransferase n=1 Tax=Haloprofundus halophilus TaxID=2283527 RepID=UPI000E444779|nr:2-phospho-L-lactate guanylyltransferase [Haloprofundus halophilus]
MIVLVPYAAARPKTRLADALDPAERESFSRAMLADVVDAVVDAGVEPTVVATESVELDARASVVVDDRPLSRAVNDRLAGAEEPTAVVMSDLALATPRVLSRLLDAGGDVVVAPGRGGGTNALVVRHPAFRVDYHGTSYLDHLRVARDVGASVREFDSMRLSTDIDEPADLVEVLLHTDGRARDWLLDAGFEVDAHDGRVGVRRER